MWTLWKKKYGSFFIECHVDTLQYLLGHTVECFFSSAVDFFCFFSAPELAPTEKKSFQTQNISQTDLSRRKSLQINENMRPSPVGFVALYSASLGLLYFYRQPERHIPNRNSTLISN